MSSPRTVTAHRLYSLWGLEDSSAVVRPGADDGSHLAPLSSPTHDKTTRRRRLSGGGTLASHLVGRAEDWPRGQQPSATKGAQTNCKKFKNQIFDGLFKSFQNGINFSFIVFWGQCPLRVDGVPHLRNTTIVVFLI